MNRFLGTLTALAVSLAVGGLAWAGGSPHSASGHSHGHSSKTNSHVNFFQGKYNHHWEHCYWNSKYRCYEYWCPSARCYYYWCPPASCYYPVTYCPYNTYCFETPSNYAAGVPVVSTPVSGAVTAIATATATATATTMPPPAIGAPSPSPNPGPRAEFNAMLNPMP